MSPGESAAPRNIQGCQVGPRAFWRRCRKGKVSGSTPAAASKARPHWHDVLSQCPSARQKKQKSFNHVSQEATSADDGEARKTQMHFVLFCFCLAACVARAVFTPRLLSNIDFQRHIDSVFILPSPTHSSSFFRVPSSHNQNLQLFETMQDTKCYVLGGCWCVCVWGGGWVGGCTGDVQ